MREHDDDVLPSVSSTLTVDSAFVTERLGGGESNEADDTMVDVVGADGDDLGRAGVCLDSKVGSDGLAEEGSVKVTGTREDGCNASSVGAMVSEEGVTGSVEVSKVRGFDGDAQKSVNDKGEGESKMVFESSSIEPPVSGGEVAVIDREEITKEVTEQSTGYVQEVADRDRATDAETGKRPETSDSLKNPESSSATVNLGPQEVDMVVVEEGLSGKEEVENSVLVYPSFVLPNHQSLSSEVAMGYVQEVAGRDRVTDEETGKRPETSDSLKNPESSSATVNLGPQEVDMVVVEEGLSGKEEVENSVLVDPSFVLPNHQSLSSEVANAGTGERAVCVSAENLDQQGGGDQISKEESPHLANEVLTGNAQTSGKETGVGDTIGGENAVVDREEESESGLTKEVVERSGERDQGVVDGGCVGNEETGKEDEVLDFSKISESSTAADPGSEDVDVVVVEEGATREDEAQEIVYVDPGLSTGVGNSGTGEGSVNVNTEYLDQKAEDDKLSKEESLHPTIEVTTTDVQKSKNGTGVGGPTLADESSRGEPHFIEGESTLTFGEEKERGLAEDKETVEWPVESVQVVADGDSVMDVKTMKEDKVLDCSVVPESLFTDNLCSEDVDVVVVEERLTRENEAQDSGSVDAPLVSPGDQSLSTEAVNAGTGEVSVHVNTENPYQQDEVDPTTKDESLLPTVEVMPTDAYHGSLHSAIEQEVVKAKTIDNSSESQTPVGGDLVSFLDTAKPFGGSGVEQIKHKVSSQPTLEVISEHHQSVIGGDQVIIASVASGSYVGGEVLTLDNQVCDSGKNIDDVEVKGLKFQAVDESSNNKDTACGEADEVAASTEVDEQTTAASKVSNSEVQVPSASGMGGVVENRRLKADDATVSSKLDVAACTEPDSSVDQTIVATAIEEIDNGGQNCKVELQIPGDMGGAAEDHGLNGDMSGKEVKTSTVEVPSTDVAEDRILTESGFSYEEAHMETAEDEGMDIDEVLGWKDEIPGTDALSGSVDYPEKDQHFTIHANSEAESEQEEFIKLRQPIVYERRVHVEVPFYDALDGHSPPQMEDETFQVETDSEEDDTSVQEEEQTAVEQPTNLPEVDAIVIEKPSTLAPVESVSGGNHKLEAHVNEAKDNSVAVKENHSVPLVEEDSISKPVADVEECSGTKPPENGASVSLHQSRYFRPPKREGRFFVSDLVWGKIRSHPWWPGQIFDLSDASEKAMKYHKKGCFLIAYFGDGTFAWNDSSVLKPFRSNFSQIEKNGSSESFKNAVKCALEEVSRRVEMGLACTCIPKDMYKKIEYQAVENGGIRRKSSRRYGIDKSAGVNFFEPDKLVDYVRLLARSPHGESDKMELVMAKAQLSSYGRYKGHRQLPEFQFFGELLEDASVPGEGVEKGRKDGEQISDMSDVRGENDASHKFEGNLDSASPKKKKRLSKKMADGSNILSNLDSSSGLKKRKARGSISDGSEVSSGLNKRRARDSNSDSSEKRPNLHPEKVHTALTPTPTPTVSSGLKRRKARGSISDGSERRLNLHPEKVHTTPIPMVTSGLKKRKERDSISDGSEKRPDLHSEKVHTALTPTPTPTPKPLFKVGECIQRVANQLTGPPSVLKGSSDRKVEHTDQQVGFAVQSPENSQRERMFVEGSQGSVAEMLSQLHLTARDPMKEHSFLNTITPFFYSYRSAVFSKSIRQSSSIGKPEGARIRKPSNEKSEGFEFDDVSDSYWTDRIIQNYSEDQWLQDIENGDVEVEVEHQLVSSEPDKPAKPSRKSKKKRSFSSDHENETESKEESELMERRRQNLATEMVLKFTEGIYFPSEMHLNKMFRRFGPLMESETEVDRQGGRARVVFKKCSDAEVAHSSAGKFNIFGSIDVNYELNYTPLTSYKPLPLPLFEDPMDVN